MATIRNRNGKWQVQVRRDGHALRSKTFQSKRDANQWAQQMEAELDANVLKFDPRVLERTTMRDLLTRYRREVTPLKRGHASENKRIDGFLRQRWAVVPLSLATPQVFSRYRDERLREVQPGTVIRDLGLLRAVFEVARTEWDIPLPENPVAKVRKPKAPDARERRLEEGELERLLNACGRNRNDWLKAGNLLAVETGMRRGELLSIKWSDLSDDGTTLLILTTKNGHARRIPLTARATQLLRELKRVEGASDERIFPVSANAFRLCWERCKRVVAEEYPGIVDLRFHDLRHEAVSRFFEMGLSVPEVALISGHRDPRMLFRYTHLRAEDIVTKFRSSAVG
ncbi:site-specific integrase [Rhodobacteraceae bacterium NNCM2]|nr:site-specific integrase [Coraliihabitans acroporae]